MGETGKLHCVDSGFDSLENNDGIEIARVTRRMHTDTLVIHHMGDHVHAGSDAVRLHHADQCLSRSQLHAVSIHVAALIETGIHTNRQFVDWLTFANLIVRLDFRDLRKRAHAEPARFRGTVSIAGVDEIQPGPGLRGDRRLPFALLAIGHKINTGSICPQMRIRLNLATRAQHEAGPDLTACGKQRFELGHLRHSRLSQQAGHEENNHAVTSVIRKPASHANNSLIGLPPFTSCTGRPVFVCST